MAGQVSWWKQCKVRKPLQPYHNAIMQLLNASFRALNTCPLPDGQLATDNNKERARKRGFSPLHIKETGCIAGIPKGKLRKRNPFCFSMNRTMLSWHNAVMCLVFLFRILSFHSSSEYVKDGSLYITNHALYFKALDKNDLTLYLWMSLLSHPNVVSMGTNVHQRRKREKKTVR